MSITFRAADHVGKVLTQVTERTTALDPAHPASAAQVASVVSAAVDSYARVNNLSARNAHALKQAVTESLAAQAADHTSALARYVAQIGVAKTQFADAQKTTADLHVVLASFRPHDFNTGTPSGELMARSMATLAPLATVLGTSLAHDTWYMGSIGGIVEGADARGIGGSKVHARPYMMSMEAVLDREPDLGKNVLFRKVLGNNRRGLEGVLNALCLNAVPPVSSIVAGGAVMPDAMAEPGSSLVVPQAVKAELHRTGSELRQVWELSQAGKSIDWTAFPRAYKAVAGAQAYWVRDQIALPADQRRYTEYKEFAALPRDVQLQNLPVAIAGVHGMLQAAAMADRLSAEGTLPAAGAPGDVDYMLHAFLATGAQQALAEPDFDRANDYHARVVALQAMTSMAGPGRGVDAAYPVFVEAAREAGKQFDPALDNKKAASEAPKVAFKYAAKALTAMNPMVSEDEAARRIQDVLKRATLDDLNAVMGAAFGRPVDSKGATLGSDLVKLNADLKDEWFTEATKMLPAGNGTPSLSVEERGVLEVLLRMANLTWMAGQVHRARGDASRVDPFKRAGVYSPYHLLTQLGSPLEALYVVAKDWHEMRKAAGLVAG